MKQWREAAIKERFVFFPLFVLYYLTQIPLFAITLLKRWGQGVPGKAYIEWEDN